MLHIHFKTKISKALARKMKVVASYATTL